jgi:ATP phosphoribosyltransferase
VEVAEILTSTARLIVNRASLKTQHARVNQLITAMREAVAGRGAAAGEPPVSKIGTSEYKK